MKTYRIGISGSYGGMNLGDEAILEVMVKELKDNINCEIVVFSKDPDDTYSRHHVRAIPAKKMDKPDVVQAMKNLDLFIVGGGGILFDDLVEDFLREITWAKENDIPVVIYAAGAGPISNGETKKMVRDTLNEVDLIIVREPDAKKFLVNLGVSRQIEVTADPGILLKGRPFSQDMLLKQGIKNDDRYPLVGFSVREPGGAAPELYTERYHDVLANAADFMVERFNAQILFVPMETGQDKDLQHSHAVIAKMVNAGKASVLKGEFTSGQILGLVKHMHFAVGMRLHFLIFAAIQRVPFVPLPYATKVYGFLQALELPMPPLHEINAGKLCAYLDRFWDSRNIIRSHLDQKVPELQESASRTMKSVKAFLENQR